MMNLLSWCRSSRNDVLPWLLLLIALPAAAQSDQERAAAFAAALSLPRMHADMLELQAVADASGGNRAASEPGHEASADYIESELQGAGLQVWREYFEYDRTDRMVDLRLGGVEGEAIFAGLLGAYSTPPQGVQGEIMLAPDERGCTLESWGDVALDGQVALVRASAEGPCTLLTQVQVAKALGAVALLTPTAPGPYQADAFPAVFIIDTAEGEAILQRVAAGEHLQAFVRTTYQTGTYSSFSVLAETGAEGPVIMLGAHLDSVRVGPGIDDNASGAAALLDVARNAAGVALPGRVRFAWWGAEEAGLFGSTRYLARLSATDPPALRAIRAYVNADMLASPNYALAVYAPEGEGAETQRIQIHAALDEYFAITGLPRVPVPAWMEGSDHGPFKWCGLATGGVASYPQGGDKTMAEQALFGGVAGEPYNRYYHRPGDRLVNTSLVPLDILSRAMAYALVRLALDPPAAVAAPHCEAAELAELARLHQHDWH